MSKEKTKEIRITIPEDLFSLILPGKTVGHLIKARKEALLALRSMIDHKIEQLDKRDKKTSEKGKKIKIE
jgi:hypothetical protein